MNCAQSPIIREGGLDAADVRALVQYHVAEMRADSPPEACHVLPSAGLDDPSVRFFCARTPGGTLLGIGALRKFAPLAGEIKSMRTAPGALGQGVGAAMLAHLVATARAAGWAQLFLETGNSALFAPAIQLYERAGFRPCGPFGDYRPTPFTRFYSLAL